MIECFSWKLQIICHFGPNNANNYIKKSWGIKFLYLTKENLGDNINKKYENESAILNNYT